MKWCGHCQTSRDGDTLCCPECGMKLRAGPKKRDSKVKLMPEAYAQVRVGVHHG